MAYRALDALRGLFEKTKYQHRRSHLGDLVASCVYEDLLALGRSPKLCERINAGRAGVNTANVTVGKQARRGDGTFGEVVPGVASVLVDGFSVPRSRIATVEVGAETKILAKAMAKQIDRVCNDLRAQAQHFRTTNPRAICVALVGVNHAPKYVSFEGRRRFVTDGVKYKHPAQEAQGAIKRLRELAAPAFDEFVLLPFAASNMPPYEFAWLDEDEVAVQYGASLARICREYELRF